MKNINKIIPLLVVSLSVMPTVVFASWWNPTTWFNKWSFLNDQNTKVEQKLIEVPEKNFATSFRETNVSIVASSSPNTRPSPTSKKEKIIPVKKIKTDSTIVDAEINARAALKAKQIQEAQIAKQKADEQAQKDALLKAQRDQNTILLQQQNDLLKQQLQAQQQIIKNTTPVPPPAQTTADVNIQITNEPNNSKETRTTFNITGNFSLAVLKLYYSDTKQLYNTFSFDTPGIYKNNLAPDREYDWEIEAGGKGYTSTKKTGKVTSGKARVIILGLENNRSVNWEHYGPQPSSVIYSLKAVTDGEKQVEFRTDSEGTKDVRTVRNGDIVIITSKNQMSWKTPEGDWGVPGLTFEIVDVKATGADGANIPTIF